MELNNGLCKYVQSTFLYILGYGDPASNSQLIKSILAMIGFVSLSLMSAHITVNLFWRIKDVRINEFVSIKRDKDRYFLTFAITNHGGDICNAEAKFSFFDVISNEMEDYPAIRTIPILKRGTTWQIDIPVVIGSVLCEYLRLMHYCNQKIKMIITYTYSDVKTGQQSIRVKEYGIDNMRAEIGQEVENPKANAEKNISNNMPVKDHNNEFTEWLRMNTYPIDLMMLRPINEGTIVLTHQTDGIKSVVDFSKPNDRRELPTYAAIAYIYKRFVFDMCYLYKKGASFLITAHCSENLQKMHLEVKNELGEELKPYPLPITQEMKTMVVPIRKIFESIEQCSSITEMLFVIYKDYLVDSEKPAEFFIEKIEIRLPDVPIN